MGKKKLRRDHEAAERAVTRAITRHAEMSRKYADDLVTYHDLNVAYAEMAEAQANASEAYDARYFGKKKDTEQRPDGEASARKVLDEETA